MGNPANTKLVFTTGAGRICKDCGKPSGSCTCGETTLEAVPSKITVKLRYETKGRAGKGVTVLDGLPRNGPFLDELSRELKRACGEGGAVKEITIEIQGDHREKLRPYLAGKGYTVKG